MTNEHILSLLNEWNSAIQTGEPKVVAALYDNDAILLPTISNEVRHNPKELEDYFEFFLTRGPKAEVLETNVRIFGELAINSGIYAISLKDGSSIDARFTFVYRWNGERWLIIEHHSSQMPEQL